jgi:hypothetical protein
MTTTPTDSSGKWPVIGSVTNLVRNDDGTRTLTLLQSDGSTRDVVVQPMRRRQ